MNHLLPILIIFSPMLVILIGLFGFGLYRNRRSSRDLYLLALEYESQIRRGRLVKKRQHLTIVPSTCQSTLRNDKK